VVLERFRWVGGHADLWPVFRDREALKAIVDELSEGSRAGLVKVHALVPGEELPDD
jgi:adenine phosphoribosyltransferase